MIDMKYVLLVFIDNEELMGNPIQYIVGYCCYSLIHVLDSFFSQLHRINIFEP